MSEQINKYYKQVGTKNYYKFDMTIPAHLVDGDYIMVTTTPKGNLQVLDVIEPQRRTVQPNIFQPQTIHGIDHEIASDSLLGCVDASVKHIAYGAHLCFKDITDSFTYEYSIGSNCWNELPYYSEARILLEAYRVLRRLPYNRPYRSVQMYSDNKRLCDILNKERLTTTDMTQDAAVLVKEIDDICKEVTFEITLTHVSMENELVSLFDNPRMFLIQRCHMESQNERTRMEMSTEKISLP